MSDKDKTADDEIDLLPPEIDRAPSDSGGVGLVTVLLCSGVAAILGVSGGTYFGGMAAKQSQGSISGESAEILTIQKDIGTVKAKLERLERQLAEVAESAPLSTSDTEGLRAIDARLKAVEDMHASEVSLEAPDLSGITDRIDTLEQAAFEPQSLDALSTMRAQLEALETQVTTRLSNKSDNGLAAANLETDILARLETLETAEAPQAPEIDLTPLEQRLAALETRVKNLPIVIPPFPRDAVLQALEEAETDDDKGWLARTFGKQVVVQNADLLARLDRIEGHVTRQDIVAIKQDVASLPQSAQTALGPWMAKVETLGNNP